jgi:hypothetical protein
VSLTALTSAHVSLLSPCLLPRCGWPVCKPGYAGASCVPCIVGTYSPGGTASSSQVCSNCPCGFTTNSTGASECTGKTQHQHTTGSATVLSMPRLVMARCQCWCATARKFGLYFANVDDLHASTYAVGQLSAVLLHSSGHCLTSALCTYLVSRCATCQPCDGCSCFSSPISLDLVLSH